MTTVAHDETFLPGKGKWALILLMFAACVAAGFQMTSRPDWRAGGYVMIVFFGFGVVIAVAQFIPGRSFLRVNSDGITVRATWRTTFYRWSDIDAFGVAEMDLSYSSIPQRMRLVGLNLSASYPGRAKPQAIRSANRALCGFEGVLPDNYGWDCAELAAHLNQLRGQYVNPEKSAL